VLDAYSIAVIWRALSRTDVPKMKEPHGLVSDDGKRPDGLTLLPWNSGRSATWDVPVVDTLENAYLQQSATTSASAAETAAVRKRNKCSSLSGTHDFFRVALETLGPMSVSTQEFLAQIGRRLTEVTTDLVKGRFFQRLSVAVQRFNAACLPNTFAIFELAW